MSPVIKCKHGQMEHEPSLAMLVLITGGRHERGKKEKTSFSEQLELVSRILSFSFFFSSFFIQNSLEQCATWKLTTRAPFAKSIRSNRQDFFWGSSFDLEAPVILKLYFWSDFGPALCLINILHSKNSYVFVRAIDPSHEFSLEILSLVAENSSKGLVCRFLIILLRGFRFKSLAGLRACDPTSLLILRFINRLFLLAPLFFQWGGLTEVSAIKFFSSRCAVNSPWSRLKVKSPYHRMNL